MAKALQRTLAAPVTVSGTGLHSGASVKLTLRPGEAGEGIVWRRIDLPGAPTVAARAEHVVATDRSTTLGNGEATIQTVEHVMAALRAMEIDACIIDCTGPETPLGDGSALPFIDAIHEAGTVTLSQPREIQKLSAPVWVENGESLLIALPADTFTIHCTFVNDWDHPALSDQFGTWEITPKRFADELAPARTIAFLAEVEALQQRGLALGGSMDAALVIGEHDIITPPRFADEPVRHKVLDIVGDLALVGHLQAKIVAVRPSHRMNIQLARAIDFASQEAQSSKT